MWQRSERLVGSPLRVVTLAVPVFFFMTSSGLFLAGLADDNGTNITNGAIGAVLFAFLIVITARGFASLDREDAETRNDLAASPPPRALHRYPRVVLQVPNTTQRAYLFSFIGLFLAVGLIALAYGAIAREPTALVVVPVIGLFLYLLVPAVGAATIADQRDRNTD